MPASSSYARSYFVIRGQRRAVFRVFSTCALKKSAGSAAEFWCCVARGNETIRATARCICISLRSKLRRRATYSEQPHDRTQKRRNSPGKVARPKQVLEFGDAA